MATLVFLFLFAAISFKRPDLGLVIYFLHWAYCRTINKKTIFDRIEGGLKAMFQYLKQGDSK